VDDALAKLADPRLSPDAIIVEASGLADPVAISRIIRFSRVEWVRPGGVVDLVDAAAHFDTVDRSYGFAGVLLRRP
jgi:G3E family GTPase